MKYSSPAAATTAARVRSRRIRRPRCGAPAGEAVAGAGASRTAVFAVGPWSLAMIWTFEKREGSGAEAAAEGADEAGVEGERTRFELGDRAALGDDRVLG